MTAYEELMAAHRGEGCLGKADPNEPVFILRGQDKLAPMLVRAWADALELHAPGARAGAAMKRKAARARELAARMERWQTRKIPD